MGLRDRLDATQTDQARKLSLGKIADLLERNGIDPADIGKVHRVNVWQGFYKDDEGQAHVVDMSGVSLSPSWESGPAWPVIAQAPPVRLAASKRKPAQSKSGWLTAVVLPDMQIGYFRNSGEQLEPIHDEAAITLALDVTRDLDPDLVVMVGDNADFAELSRFRLSPAFQRTTQATLDRCAILCAQVRAVAPRARIVWLAGNHEERLPNWIIDNAKAAFGLRQGASPLSWPVMSMPHLCRMDEHGVEYMPGYPASKVWINERLQVVHGHKHNSSGVTATKYLGSEKVSTIFGHVHRREYAAMTRPDWDGGKTIMAATPGCLCRTDGVVPSTKGGMDLDGRPIPIQEDWQQGLAVVHYMPGDNDFVYENVAIHDSWCFYQGRTYR